MRLPTLETERLRLRRVELRDAPLIQKLADDYEVAANTLNMPHPYPVGAAEEWIQRTQQAIADGTQALFAIAGRTDDAFMGAIGLHFIRRDRSAEMGYWLGRPFWQQGYMTEAAWRVLRYGFEEHGLNRIFASVFADNRASQRVLEKIGMTYEGTMRQHVLKWETFKDMARYGILWDEFEQRHD